MSVRGRILLLAVVGAIVAVVVTRIDIEEALREITLPLKHEDSIRQQADEKDLDPALIAAVIYAESRFNADARSEAGARGLMQLTPATAREIERLSGGTTFRVADLADSDINIRYGTFYLRYLLDLFDENVIAALAAYHAGPTRVAEWGGASLAVEGIPGDGDFADTRAYVDEVLEKREEYRDNYGDELGL